MRRRRGLGLLGTTVVAGGMYAAGRGSANRAAQERSQDARLAALEEEPPRPAQPAAPAATPAPAPPAGEDDRIDRLRQLADLHDSGVLDDAEFQAEKRRLLAS
jgi:hypothetical protein